MAASLAKLSGVELPDVGLADSHDELDTLLGQDVVGRPHLIHEAGKLALRQGPWKFIPPATTREGLGPWKQVKIAAPGFLFDLSHDIGETTDLAARNPPKLAELSELLNKLIGGWDR